MPLKEAALTRAQALLKAHWGYTSLRPSQQEAIATILEGHDLLVLMPTGGGKSLCFQLPTLMQEGLCLVISPLIALMQDQVEALLRREIPAVALHAGMSGRAIDMALDNCAYGRMRFLYLSPERLTHPLFLARLPKMPVCLIAVDEAHCIAEWGHDFRPSYLQIAALREHLPGISLVALTASATPAVQKEIREHLAIAQGSVVQQSFARANLTYVVRRTEDRAKSLKRILSKVKGSAILYAPTRRATERLTGLLTELGFQADYYHAGLPTATRMGKQARWLSGACPIMVATNAFGMGIDKANVRLVLHVGLPQSLEAYYQEAGRAGRDGAQAYAVLLLHPQDIDELKKKTKLAYPPEALLRRVYQALANYYQVAVGSTPEEAYPFDVQAFSTTYRLPARETHTALQRLSEQGFIAYQGASQQQAQVRCACPPGELYAFRVAHPAYDRLIAYLLRRYGSELVHTFLPISLATIAKDLACSPRQVNSCLTELMGRGIFHYRPEVRGAQVAFLTVRYSAQELPLKRAFLAHRQAIAEHRSQSVIHYVTHPSWCRAQCLLAYFGERSRVPCEHCDRCRARQRAAEAAKPEQQAHAQQAIRQVLAQGPCSVQELCDRLSHLEEATLLEGLSYLLDQHSVTYSTNLLLTLSPA